MNPIQVQEDLYHLPYHWFPETRLKQFEREEKQRIVFDLINLYGTKPIGRYLDIGCGDGRWTADIHHFVNQTVQTLGIDFSERAVRFAQLIVPDIDFRVHYGEELPFEPSLFDLVSAIEVIEHVESEAEEQFLTELRRVLRKGGLLILTTPSWNLPLTNHHFRHYSAGRLCELLERTGFDVLDLRGQSIPCFGRRRKIRKWMNLFPVIWKIWRFTYRETRPEKSLNLIVAARPTEDT